MIDPVNLLGDEWELEEERPGYRRRVLPLRSRLGGELIGASLYELPAGEKTWPYHYELGCEEWLIVVSGRPTLRTPAGERELVPGDVAVFPEGAEGAHQVLNRSDEPARVIIFSNMSPLAVAFYPDSGKLGIWSGPPGFSNIVSDGPTLDYWDGES